MSSNLLEFQAEEKSNRAAFGVQGRFRPKGNIGVDVGTSGTYKPIDADIETPDTKNASANVGVGGQVRVAGGTAGHTEDDPDGKGTKHRRDSSSSSSSSSSSDEEGNQEKTSKAKRKKKRKGILSGSFLPKFGTSKKTKGKDDDTGRMAPEKVEVGLDVSPSRKLERPQSTEVEIQTDLGMEAAKVGLEGNIDESGTQADPDVEIFHCIGADRHNDDTDHQCEDVNVRTLSVRENLDHHGAECDPHSLGPLEVDLNCGSEWSAKGFTPPGVKRVTVKASGVEKFPAPALRSVSGDGTDVDLGLSAKFGEDLDDSTSENMDTSDFLSQVENAIKSIEAAQEQQQPDIAMPVISAGVDESIRQRHGNVHLNSADIAAVNVDSDPALHVHLAKPKEGPILELPEGDAELATTHISIEHSTPNAPSQADLGTGRHLSTSSSRSSQGEQKQKSKGILPSIKFQFPKFGGKKSSVNTDGDANLEVDGSISVHPDPVTSPYNIDHGIDSPQSTLDTSLPDVDKSNSSDIHLNTSLDTTVGSNVDPEVDLGNAIGSEGDVSHLSPQQKEESDDNSDIDAYLGAAAIDIGLPVPVDMDFDASVDTAGAMETEVSAKPKSKKTKRKLPKFKFGSKKAGKVDLPSGDVNLATETPDFEANASVDAERSDAAFEVVGKRASLKRNLEVPDVEAPVALMLESNVESLPVEVEVDGHSSPEVNINLSHPDIGIDEREKYMNQDKGIDVNGGLNERSATLDMGVQYEWPNTEVDGDHSDVALQVECDLDVDESSDIEAYIGVSSPSDTYPAGVTAVGPTIQGPDSTTKSSFQYNKGKMSKKGTRNLPKVKTKGSRNAFGGKTKKPDDRVDMKVDMKGTRSDLKMEIHPHNLDVAGPVKPDSRRSSGDVKASSSEPNLVFNDESKHKRKGFTLPRLKMPKFKKSGRKSSQDKTMGDSFDLEVGGTVTPTGKRSSSLPDISYASNSDGGGNTSSYLDTTNKRKKRWSTGFRLPNFGFAKFGGKQRPQSETDRSGFDEVDVSVSNPDIRAGISMDVNTLPDDVFPADDGPKEKVPKSDINFESDVPDLGIDGDVILPEGGVDVDHGGDAKVLGWPQHKADMDKNITIPSIELKDNNVDSPEVEVKMNMVEEVSSAPIEVNERDVRFKSGISGGVHVGLEPPVRASDEEFGVDIAAPVGGDFTFPGVDFTQKRDADVVSITSSSSESDKYSAKKKKGLFGGIHLPKFKGKSSSKKHIGTGVSFDDEEMDVDLGANVDKGEINMAASNPDVTVDQKEFRQELDVDVNDDPRIEDDIDIKPPEFAVSGKDINLPDVSEHGDVDDDGKQDISKGFEVDANLHSEDINIDADVDVPTVDVDIPAVDDDLDVNISSDLNVPGDRVKVALDGDNHSVSSSSSSSSSSSEDEKTKKKGFFGGLHFPKFKGKGSNKKAETRDINLRNGQNVDIGIGKPKGYVDAGDFDGDVDVATRNISVDEKGPKPEFHAEISTPDVDLHPHMSVDDSHPKGEAEVDISVKNVGIDVDANVHRPEFELSNLDTDADLPSGNVEVNVNMSGANDGDINIPREDVGGRGAISLPAIGIKEKNDDNKSVSSTSSSSSVSDTASDKANKKKKGLFGGFHLPKFKGSGSPKRTVDADAPVGGMKVSGVKVDVGDASADNGADVVVPDLNGDQREFKSNVDADVSIPNVSNLAASGGMDLPLGDGEKEGSSENIKIGADVDVPKVYLSTQDHGCGSDEQELPSGNAEFGVSTNTNVDISDKVKAKIDVPDKDIGLDIDAEVDISLHRFDVNVKGDGDNKSVTSTSSSSSSESEKTKKKKKGFFGGIHFPKFKGKGSSKKAIGTGVSFDDDNDMEVDTELPRGGIDLNYEGDASVPNVSVDQNAVKAEIDVSVNDPVVQLPEAKYGVDVAIGSDDFISPAIDVDLDDLCAEVDVPAASVQVDIPTDNMEASIPGGDVDTDTRNIVLKPNVDLPNVKMDASGDAEMPSITDARDNVPDVDLEGEVSLPAATGDIDVSGGIRIPRFGKEGNLEDDRKSTSSSSSSSSSESEKNVQKKKGLFSGFHLPKFMGKGPKVKGPKASGDVKREFPGAKVDVDAGGDLAVGIDVATPHVSVDEKVSRPEFDVDVSSDVNKPDVSAEINVPVAEVEDLPDVKVKADADLPTPEIKSGGSIDNKNLEVDLKGEFSPIIQGNFDAGGGISIPILGPKDSEDDKVSISSSSSCSSSDSDKGKKKGLASFDMPKFKGNGSPDKNLSKDLDISFDGDLSLAGPEMPSLVEGHGGHGSDAEVELSGDVDLKVNVPKPSGESPEVNLNLDIKDKDRTVDVENPDFAGDFKLSGPAPGQQPATTGDIDVSGGIRIPRFGKEDNLEDDRKSISSSSSSSSSESEKNVQKKKGLFSGFHLPKFMGKGPKVKGPKASGDVKREFPGAKVDVDAGGDLAVGIDVATPHVSVDEKVSPPEFDVDMSSDVNKPDVSAEINVPVAEVEDLPDVKVKADADLPTPEIKSGGSIDNKNLEVDLKGEFSPIIQGNFDAGGGISIPKLGPKDSEDDKVSISSSSSCSSSDSDKGKKKRLASLDIPKFKGNGSPDKNLSKDLDISFDGDLSLAGPEMPSLVEGHGGHGSDAEVELSGDVDLNVNIPKPSGESPEVNLNLDIKDKDRTVDVENPDFAGDFKLSGPAPELSLVGGADVNIPSNEVSVDVTIPNREVDGVKPSLDVKVEDPIDIIAPDVVVKGTLVENDPHILDIPGDAKLNVTVPECQVSSEGDFHVSDVNAAGIPRKETKNVRFPDVDLVVKDDDSLSDTSSSSDSDGDDKKKKKGFFGSLHFPKFKGKGPKKKPGVKVGRKGDVTLDLDKNVDVLSDDHNLRGEVEIPQADGTLSPEVDVNVKVDKYEPSADITAGAGSGNKDPSLDIGAKIGEPNLDVSLNLPKASVDSDVTVDLVPDVDPTIGGAHDQGDVDVEGSVKLPEIRTGDADHPRPEIDVNSSLVKPDVHMGLDVDIGKVDSDIPNMNDANVDSVDTDIKVKGGINVDVDPSLQEGGPVLPGLNTGKETDDVTSSSSDSDDSVKVPEDSKRKKKGFLPSFHLPKMHLKRSKSPDKKKGRSAANVEVELKLDVDVPDTDVGGAVTTGPDLWDSSIGVSDPDGGMKFQVDEPEVAVSTAKPEKPEIDLDLLGQQEGTSFNVGADFLGATHADVTPSVDNSIEVPAPRVNIDSSVPDVPGEEEREITFENFGKLLAESEQFDVSDSNSSEVDSKEKDEDFVGEVDLQADIKVNASQPERKLDLDVDWTQLGLDVSDDEREPSAHINAGQSLTRSSSKSSLSSSSSEEQKQKKTKGFLPSLKLSKFTGGKGQGPTVKVKGGDVGELSGDVEGKVTPSVKVDVESSPPDGSPREGKAQKGRLGLFRKGRGKKGDSPQSPQQEVAVPEVSVTLESTPQRPPGGLHPKSDISPPSSLDLSGAVATHSMPTTPLASAPSTPQSHFSVVVAIDFGTTFSGYAYSFTKDPENIHVMRKCEGGDPGVVNMKILTTLLMTPEGEFHSFGFTARDFYHDMKFTEAQRWLYFDKYKLALNDHKNLNIDTELTASNGTKVKALTVFEQTLRFFKDRFLEELMDLSMDDGAIDEGDIRWVLTVPAIWRQPAKQFMRQAAYKAGIASPARPSQLMIALEPEAASIYIGKLSMRQLMPERMALRRERWLRGSMGKGNDPDLKVIEDMKQGSRYVVVDCGGGTVDITVHEVEKETGTLRELHKASGGMFGSGNVDEAFIKLMVDIFGSEFIEEFKVMRPAGWVDLLIAFEARKRNANPWKANFLNVSLPFSFIDYYKKFTNGNLTVEQTLFEYNDPDVKWSGHSPGMLRFSPEGMSRLFTPTTSQLLSMLDKVLAIPELEGVSHLFLAGGFAESPLLQNQIRDQYKDILKVVIPQDVGLATMKGAVMFGQNPGAVSMRRARLTYGVGALNKFDPKIHPEEKKIVKDGLEWCRDVFDIFVHADQSVSAGEKVTRSYAPASAEQEAIKINIYCSENDNARFITDDQVRKCGTLTIDLSGKNKGTNRRELQLSMHFGDTEMRVDALDVSTGKKVEARVDFLNN